MQVRSYAAYSPKEDLKPYVIERRKPVDKDVLIDIQYCGVCHSDIHTCHGDWAGVSFPVAPGHEIAGIVLEIGPNVTKFKVGDRVGVGCMVDYREDGQEAKNVQYSKAGSVMTYGSRDRQGNPTQGGYSEKITVTEDFVLRIPDSIPLELAAPLLCAGITVYSPLRYYLPNPQGKKVAVVGLGGLGHLAVKYASALGAEVTVLSQSLSKQEDGLRFGAKHYYAATPEKLTELARSFDVILSTVSSVDTNWAGLLGALDADGTLVVLGGIPEPLPIPSFALLFGRKKVAGSLIGDVPETQEMLDFSAAHNILPEIELTSIQNINEAYKRVLKSDVKYRFVIDMATLKSE